MTLRTLNLGNGMEAALASGHPWIYRNHLPSHPKVEHGEWVRLEAGSAVAVGLYDRDSKVAVRIFTREGVPGRELLAGRVEDALALRRWALAGSDTNAYRLLFGEGDYLPGITVDRYDRFAVFQTYAGSVDVIVPDVVRALKRTLRLKGMVHRHERGLLALWGELPPPEVTVVENGVKLIADLHQGQKTGLFLDHRDNRAALERYCAGRSLLNVFSYTGAYALYAIRGGARRVTNIDSARPVLEAARRNLALNGIDPDDHEFIVGDAFEQLAALASERRRFDIVLLDPPSFARHRGQRHKALRAYRRLNELALHVTEPGGLLATASCTAQVTSEDFRLTLDAARTAAGVRLQLLQQAGHAPDHPVPSSFPEGRYLKFVIARVLPG